MIVRQLLTKWGVDVDDRQLTRLNGQIKNAKKRFTEAGRGAKDLGKKFSLFATLPIAALGGVFIKAASDAEETRTKFGTVFSGIADDAQSVAEDLDKNFGLSGRAAQGLLADTGDLLTGFGFTQQEALKLSEQTQKLAVDLASFTNFSGGAEGASKALTKALLGERESVKSLGISIQEEDVKKEVQLLRTQGVTFATERQAKAQAALNIALRQSKNAIGDFARTSGGFANSLRDFKGEVEDLAVEFGEVLLPIATDILNNFLKPAIKWFRGLTKETKTYILITAGLVAAIGPLLIAFGFMAQGLVGMVSLVTILLPLLSGLTAASLGLAAVWLGAFAAIFLVLEDILAFAQGRKSVLGFLVQQFGVAIDAIGEKFKELPGIVKSVVASILLPLRAVINGIQGVAGAIGALTSGDFSLAADALKEAFTSTVMPNMGDFGSLLGFSSNERMRPTPDAQRGAGTAAMAGGNNAQVSVQNTISVPAGTPPDLVDGAVTKGVRESMDRTFRETREVVQPQVAF